jgi:hypothetical protein
LLLLIRRFQLAVLVLVVLLGRRALDVANADIPTFGHLPRQRLNSDRHGEVYASFAVVNEAWLGAASWIM